MDIVVKGTLVAGGLLCAAFAQLLALALAGAGHGWVAPFFFSPFLFIAYPFVFVRTVGMSRYWVAADIVLIVAAVAADISLARGTYVHEAIYFKRAMDFPPLPQIWIAIWAIWQLVTAYRIWRAFAHRSAGPD